MSESEKKLAFATKLFQSVKGFSFLMKLRACFYFFDSLFLFFKKKAAPEKSAKKRICILVLTGLGDCIIFCRMADALKKAFPWEQYELTILSNDTHQKLLSQFFENVIGMPFYKMSFNLFARIRILSQLRQLVFDELWDLNGCGECTPNIFISNAVNAREKRIAYPGLLDCGRRISICPEWMKRKIYTEIVSLPDDIHLLTMFQMFLQQVSGKEMEPGTLVFPMRKPDGIPEKYFVFVPSGSHSRNMWGAEKFSELGKLLYEKRKLPILLCGSSGDFPECLKIEQNLKLHNIPVFNMAGKTSFEELCWLLKNAEEVFTIDTGSFHLAVASDVKTSVIAPDAVFNLYVNYPETMRKKLKIHHAGMNCRDCGHVCHDVSGGIYPCVRAVSVDEVLK